MQRKIKVTRRQYERIVLAYRIIGFFAIVGLLIWYSFLVGKPIEFAFIFLPYFVTKGFYSRQYHANSLKQCLVLSIVIFALAITFTVPKWYSICFSTSFGLLIAFLSCKAGDKQAWVKELSAFYENAMHPKPFNVDTCTESELLERCKSLNYNTLKTQMAVKFFIEKEKPRDVWLWLCETQDNPIGWDSVKQAKWRMKKELFD